MIDPGDGEEVILDVDEVEEWVEEQQDEHYGNMADECLDGS